MRQRLTDSLIKDLAPPTDRQQRIFQDDLVRGFGVRVTKGGAKSFVLSYITRAGRERRFTIGSCGHWEVAAARREAKRLRQMIDSGGDPLQQVVEAREAISVNQMLDEYIASTRFKAKAALTQRIDTGRIDRHLRPLLGRIVVDQLTAADVERAHNAIVEGRTRADEKTGPRGRAIVRGGAGTARKAIKLLSAAFSWAVATGRAKDNPCRHIETAPDGIRDVVLSPDHYERMWRALAALEEIGALRSPAADCIRLIALTGCRRGEAARLRWRDVRLDQGVLVLAEHKTARSTGRPRIIGLPDTARRVIERQPRGEPDDYVFVSSAGPQAPIALGKPWAAVRRLARLPGDAGLHCLRHSIATAYAEAGATAPAIMTLMGHAQLSTAQRYVHIAEGAHAQIARDAAALVLGPPKPKS